MVESLSEAVMVNEVPLMSKQKQSRMGKVFFCTMTRPMVIRRDERVELEITNFMRIVLDVFVLIVVLPRCFFYPIQDFCVCANSLYCLGGNCDLIFVGQIYEKMECGKSLMLKKAHVRYFFRNFALQN